MKIINFIEATFNNREISLGLWFIAFTFLVLIKRKILISIFDLIKLLFGKAIFRMIIFMLIYVSTLIFILYICNLWELTLLKDTIYWTFGFAFIMLFNANKAYEEEHFFENIIKDNFKFIIIFEFITNLHCFNLIWELIFLPIMLFLVLINTFSEYKKEFHQIQKITNVILSIIGIMYLIIALYYIFINLTNFISYNNLRSFLFAPLLTFFYIPFHCCPVAQRTETRNL